MTKKQFEHILGRHCSPTLLGIKPANLVSFPKAKAPNLMELLKVYRPQLRDLGIRMRIVCGCKKHYLLLVYRPELLESYLSQPQVEKYLASYGYTSGANIEQYLQAMTLRYAKNQQCPDEIGIFLGYPLEDVIGFSHDPGDACKYVGFWKVYGDVPSAIEIFARYKECIAFTCEKIKEGFSLAQVIQYKETVLFI